MEQTQMDLHRSCIQMSYSGCTHTGVQLFKNRGEKINKIHNKIIMEGDEILGRIDHKKNGQGS